MLKFQRFLFLLARIRFNFFLSMPINTKKTKEKVANEWIHNCSLNCLTFNLSLYPYHLITFPSLLSTIVLHTTDHNPLLLFVTVCTAYLLFLDTRIKKKQLKRIGFIVVLYLILYHILLVFSSRSKK